VEGPQPGWYAISVNKLYGYGLGGFPDPDPRLEVFRCLQPVATAGYSIYIYHVTGADAERLKQEAAEVLLPMGLRLSEEKTVITHIDDGLDFLGFRIRRKRKQGAVKRYVYTYPSKAAVAAIKAKVRALTHRSAFPTLAALLTRVNSTLRGWAAYFQHGVSKRTFSAIGVFAWRRVIRWLRKRHHRASWAKLLRRYLPGWVPTDEGITLFNPVTVPVTRYRYRGTKIPNPWTATTPA